jgi:hypothetical protein
VLLTPRGRQRCPVGRKLTGGDAAGAGRGWRCEARSVKRGLGIPGMGR